MEDITGKTCIITGASSEIGRGSGIYIYQKNRYTNHGNVSCRYAGRLMPDKDIIEECESMNSSLT